MSAFCRIRLEDVEAISDLALSKGLEHNILPFEGDSYSDWVTIQLTNDYSRRAFENLCYENDVTVDGTQIVYRMMDSVLDGTSPERVLDEALTPGMKRAMSNGAKFQCKECGQPIPKYPGRYPCTCPECKGAFAESLGLREAAKPVGKAQKAIIALIQGSSVAVDLNDMLSDPSFRLISFMQADKAAEALAKKGLISYKNGKVTKRLSEASDKKHTVWKWIPKNWQDMFNKKKVKLKQGQDEVVTIHPSYGEVSIGKGMFRTKVIEPGKAEVSKVLRSLKPSQVW